MRSGSTSLAAATAALLLLAACARPAPPLPVMEGRPPPTLAAGAEAARCAALADGITTDRAEMQEIEAVMAGRRGRDQVTAYLAAVLYPPLLSVIDQQRARKRALDERQARIDAALVERRARHCPQAPIGVKPPVSPKPPNIPKPIDSPRESLPQGPD